MQSMRKKEDTPPPRKESAQFVLRDGAGVLGEALELSLGRKSKMPTAYPSATGSGTMSEIGFGKNSMCEARWHLPVIVASRKLGQEDHKFKDSLGYVVRCCVKNNIP